MQVATHADLLNTIAQNLTHATAILLLTQSNLDQFLQHLQASSLPMYYWPTTQLKRFALLQKQNSSALRDFERARQFTFTKASESKFPPPEPPPPPRRTLESIYQNIKVETIDGKSVSTINPTGAFLVDRHVAKNLVYISRQFHFVGGIVPPEYGYVLMDDGVTQEPNEFFEISYYSEEFERISRLETKTHSPHVLDGERCHYERIVCRET